MKNVTATEIKHIQSNFTPLNKFGVEASLDTILAEECELELPKDIDSYFS